METLETRLTEHINAGKPASTFYDNLSSTISSKLDRSSMVFQAEGRALMQQSVHLWRFLVRHQDCLPHIIHVLLNPNLSPAIVDLNLVERNAQLIPWNTFASTMHSLLVSTERESIANMVVILLNRSSDTIEYSLMLLRWISQCDQHFQLILITKMLEIEPMALIKFFEVIRNQMIGNFFLEKFSQTIIFCASKATDHLTQITLGKLAELLDMISDKSILRNLVERSISESNISLVQLLCSLSALCTPDVSDIIIHGFLFKYCDIRHFWKERNCAILEKTLMDYVVDHPVRTFKFLQNQQSRITESSLGELIIDIINLWNQNDRIESILFECYSAATSGISPAQQWIHDSFYTYISINNPLNPHSTFGRLTFRVCFTAESESFGLSLFSTFIKYHNGTTLDEFADYLLESINSEPSIDIILRMLNRIYILGTQSQTVKFTLGISSKFRFFVRLLSNASNYLVQAEILKIVELICGNVETCHSVLCSVWSVNILAQTMFSECQTISDLGRQLWTSLLRSVMPMDCGEQIAFVQTVWNICLEHNLGLQNSFEYAATKGIEVTTGLILQMMSRIEFSECVIDILIQEIQKYGHQTEVEFQFIRSVLIAVRDSLTLTTHQSELIQMIDEVIRSV